MLMDIFSVFDLKPKKDPDGKAFNVISVKTCFVVNFLCVQLTFLLLIMNLVALK